MRKTLFTLMSLLTMLAAGLSADAQEITTTLLPGWTWIGYPYPESVDLETVFGDFEPMPGDMIESRYGYSEYLPGYGWFGLITCMEPGLGYLYHSNRTETVNVVLHAPASQFMVTTAEPIGITATDVLVGGTVTASVGGHVFLRGVCWGTEPNPNLDGSYTIDGTGTGVFSTILNNLIPNTTYSVRAYAVSDQGLTYGNKMTFTTEIGSSSNAPSGAINGKFTINSNGTQVYFSQGNLQYIGSASTPYWKFADNQWDILGTTTGQNSTSSNVDRDLFGWGTSGWHNSSDPYNVNYQPWSTSAAAVNVTYNYYGYGPSTNMPAPNLTGSSANYDWGVYNSISNGGNQQNQWRTLTKNEWDYIFNTRITSSGIRYAKAIVNNVNGVILLPDDWIFSYYPLSDINTSGASFGGNIISATQWSTLEQHGAVFLPAAGFRFGPSILNVGSAGFYWSASYCDSSSVYILYFLDNNLRPKDYRNRSDGRSVRLVTVCEN